jgi:hypothetical protein
MATFTWNPGVTGNWDEIDNWSSKTSAPPPPGGTSQGADVANLPGGNSPYTVTIAAGETFDIAMLHMSGRSQSATTSLAISGTLVADSIVFKGRSNSANVDVLSGGQLDISTDLTAAHRETLTIAGTGLGGHVELGSPTISGASIDDRQITYDFSNNMAVTNAGEIEFNGPSFDAGAVFPQVITNVAPGDKFVFDHADFTNDTVLLSPDGTLTVTDTDNNVVLTMKNVSMANGAPPTFEASGDTIVATACYLAGTHILTPSGELPIEALAIGDTVTTSSGNARPIKWIGRRSYEGRFIAGNSDVLPIRIASGALADGIPKRDLYVSPGHAMLIDGFLIPAEKLINGISIHQIEAVDKAEYFHLELDSHDVIFAEGATSETYVECDNRNRFQNGHEFAELYPGVVAPSWAYCAPWISDGEVLARVRRTLDERLGLLGYSRSLDPALRLLIDGCEMEPDVVQGSAYIFRLLKRPGDVRIVSRTSIPAAVGAGNDRRRLGVNLTALIMRSDTLTLMVEHGHPLLSDGFHQAETTHRWTNGNARIPPEFLACFGDRVIVELRLLDRGLVYRVEQDSSNGSPAAVPIDQSSLGLLPLHVESA